jgi:5-methylcytosine-specific restriction protein A
MATAVKRRCQLCGRFTVHACVCVQKRQVDRRGKTSERGYDWTWQRFRQTILAARPLCEDCQAEGRAVPGRDVHHVAKIRNNPDRRLDPTAVRVLCSVCHDRRTARGE